VLVGDAGIKFESPEMDKSGRVPGIPGIPEIPREGDGIVGGGTVAWSAKGEGAGAGLVGGVREGKGETRGAAGWLSRGTRGTLERVGGIEGGGERGEVGRWE
jgi:hypothetical protein